MEFRVLRSWNSFTDVFEDAEPNQTVTYCDSPHLILQILEEDENINTDSLEAVGGDSTPKKYREKLTNRRRSLPDDGTPRE
ncbi:MAG: hypothetical protein ACQET5_13755 [Halobacteriota archaeon]